MKRLDKFESRGESDLTNLKEGVENIPDIIHFVSNA
jgi:hypothetical protein